MRRVLPILFSAFYLFASIGVAATVHLCGGKVADVSLSVIEEKPCCCGPAEATKQCCQNRVIAFEIPADDYLPSKIGFELSDVTFTTTSTEAEIKDPNFRTSRHAIAVDWLAYLPPGKTIRIKQKSLLFYS